MASPNATNCTALVAHASHPASVALGIGFFFGMLISFIPQLVKIQSRRSSTGISPIWVFFSACMGTANVIGGVLLQQGLFTCCRPGARWQCVEVLLPLLTLCLNALMTGSVFTLCARHGMCVRRGGGGSGGSGGGGGETARRHSLNYKTTVGAGEHEEHEGGGRRGGSGSGSGADLGAGAGDEEEEEEGGVGSGAVKPVRWRWVFALWSVFAATSWAVAMAGSYGGLEGVDTKDMGEAYGVIATVLTCVQWFPQLYTTFRLKTAGSLSLLTLAIQAPGSVGWAVYLAVASTSEPSTWSPPMVTGAMQVTLLCMCVVYERRRRRGAAKTGAKKGAKKPLLAAP
jgi:uncharacterized protein with PQ loop repeat